MTDSALMKMRFGRYEIRDRLGAGGMARVFKGYDANLERLVAIKIMHDHLTEEPTFKERFEREARLVASLNHPNIVQVYDFDTMEIDGQPVYYMVMPYIPGKSLKGVLDDLAERGERLPQEEVIDVLHHLSDALSYAHARGMVHRDVKPANILFNERGQAVLTDFGIARMVQHSKLTQEGTTTGTPAYMSPEQVLGLPADARSDLYALAVIAFEMLTGRLPFTHDESPAALMLKHINDPIPQISQFLSAENLHLDAVFLRALAKNPDDRYPGTQEFFRELRAALEGETLLHTTPPFLESQTTQVLNPTQQLAREPAHRLSRSLFGLAAIALTVIVFLAALVLMQRGISQNGAQPTGSSVDSMTGDLPVFFHSAFDGGSPYDTHWPQTTTAELASQITEGGFYRLHNPEPGTAVTSIFDMQYTYEDAAIQMEGLLEDESQVASGYGIVFNYHDQDHYSVFAVDGAGRYSIWTRKDGVWRELRGESEAWTTSEAVQPIGSANVLRVEVHGSHYTGYVNDTLVAEVVDDAPASGNIGIYLATPGSGTATVLIDSYSVEAVNSSAGDEP